MKPGSTVNRWTDAEDAALASFRADRVTWPDIAKHMPGRTAQACQQRQVYLTAKAAGKKKKGCGRKRKRSNAKASGDRRDRLAKQAIAFAVARAEILAAEKREAEARRLAGVSAKLPRARRVSTHVLVTDAELRSKIELQGPTAGLLGDPLPGRSALDERNARQGAI